LPEDSRTLSPALSPHDSTRPQDVATLEESETSSVRVIVGGEHRIFAAAFEQLFEKTFQVTSGSSGEPFLDEVRRLQPHVIIKGLSTNVPRGLESLTKVRQAAPHGSIIVVTMWDDATIVTETFRRGASAYLLQTCEPSEFLSAVHAVIHGKTYIASCLAGAAFDALALGDTSPDAELTERQRSIVSGVAQGKSMKQIAADLQISTRTVAFSNTASWRSSN
jgi:DNA-binding NarL/FixJ family response regulator